MTMRVAEAQRNSVSVPFPSSQRARRAAMVSHSSRLARFHLRIRARVSPMQITNKGKERDIRQKANQIPPSDSGTCPCRSVAEAAPPAIGRVSLLRPEQGRKPRRGPAHADRSAGVGDRIRHISVSRAAGAAWWRTLDAYRALLGREDLQARHLSPLAEDVSVS